MPCHGGLFEVLRSPGPIIHLAATLTTGPSTGVGDVQRRIASPCGNQVDAVMRDHVGVRGTAAWGLFRLPLGRSGHRDGVWVLLLRGGFGLAGSFLGGAAHDLLDAYRKGAPCVDTHARECKAGEAEDRLLIQTGEETI